MPQKGGHGRLGDWERMAKGEGNWEDGCSCGWGHGLGRGVGEFGNQCTRAPPHGRYCLFHRLVLVLAWSWAWVPAPQRSSRLIVIE